MKVRASIKAIRWWPVPFAIHSAAGAWFTAIDGGAAWTVAAPVITFIAAVVAWLRPTVRTIEALPPAVGVAAVARMSFIVGVDGRTVASKIYAGAAQFVIVCAATILAAVTLSTVDYFKHAKGQP